MIEQKVQKKKKGCLRSKRLLAYDIFGSTVNFNYADGETQYRSTCGALLSLSITFITLLFTIQQTIVLKNYEGTLFTTSIQKNSLEDDYTVTEEDGFQIAITIIDQFDLSKDELPWWITLVAYVSTSSSQTNGDVEYYSEMLE